MGASTNPLYHRLESIIMVSHQDLIFATVCDRNEFWQWLKQYLTKVPPSATFLSWTVEYPWPNYQSDIKDAELTIPAGYSRIDIYYALNAIVSMKTTHFVTIYFVTVVDEFEDAIAVHGNREDAETAQLLNALNHNFEDRTWVIRKYQQRQAEAVEPKPEHQPSTAAEAGEPENANQMARQSAAETKGRHGNRTRTPEEEKEIVKKAFEERKTGMRNRAGMDMFCKQQFGVSWRTVQRWKKEHRGKPAT